MGPKSGLDGRGKSRPPPEFDPRTVPIKVLFSFYSSVFACSTCKLFRVFFDLLTLNRFEVLKLFSLVIIG